MGRKKKNTETFTKQNFFNFSLNIYNHWVVKHVRELNPCVNITVQPYMPPGAKRNDNDDNKQYYYWMRFLQYPE